MNDWTLLYEGERIIGKYNEKRAHANAGVPWERAHVRNWKYQVIVKIMIKHSDSENVAKILLAVDGGNKLYKQIERLYAGDRSASINEGFRRLDDLIETTKKQIPKPDLRSDEEVRVALKEKYPEQFKRFRSSDAITR